MAVMIVVVSFFGCVVARFQHQESLRLRKRVAHDVTGDDNLTILQAFYASTDVANKYLSAADQKRLFAHWLAEGRMIDRVACCLSCGYSLRGLTADYCPECGWELPDSFLQALRRGQNGHTHRANALPSDAQNN